MVSAGEHKKHTDYEKEVTAWKDHVLEAVRLQSDADKAAIQIIKTVAPNAIASQQDGVLTFKPLSARDKDKLAAAFNAAIGDLIHDSLSKKLAIMQNCFEGRSQPALAELLDTIIWLAEKRALGLDISIPASCLERVVEAVTVAECEGVFAFLDSRISFFKHPQARHQCQFALLRTGNTLLRRLSKSHNAMLCGRILLFLAKLLPLTEKSGVNLHGSFNTQNVTPIADVQEGAVDSEGNPVDVDFYKTFWGLQAYFNNPALALSPASWAKVSAEIRKVLGKFKSVEVSITETAPESGRKSDGLGISVKYLSSSRLLGLQLRDATLRRHFLLQCLILMHWCENPHQKEAVVGSAKGLKGRPLEDLQALKNQVYGALEATPERGAEFAAAIRHLMSWEDSWAAWKKGGCPDFQKPPLAMPADAPPADQLVPPHKKRRISSEAYYGIRVGTEELDRLWNISEDNLSMLSAADRGGFKSLRQLMDPVINELNEGGDGDEQFKASRNKVYSWKALRVLARENLPVFAQTVQRGGDLEVAARALYPAECPPAPAPAPTTSTPAPSGALQQSGQAHAADDSPQVLQEKPAADTTRTEQTSMDTAQHQAETGNPAPVAENEADERGVAVDTDIAMAEASARGADDVVVQPSNGKDLEGVAISPAGEAAQKSAEMQPSSGAAATEVQKQPADAVEAAVGGELVATNGEGTSGIAVKAEVADAPEGAVKEEDQ